MNVLNASSPYFHCLFTDASSAYLNMPYCVSMELTRTEANVGNLIIEIDNDK